MALRSVFYSALLCVCVGDVDVVVVIVVVCGYGGGSGSGGGGGFSFSFLSLTSQSAAVTPGALGQVCDFKEHGIRESIRALTFVAGRGGAGRGGTETWLGGKERKQEEER